MMTIAATWHPTWAVFVAQLLDVPPAPSSQVMDTTVLFALYSLERRMAGRFFLSHELP